MATAERVSDQGGESGVVSGWYAQASDRTTQDSGSESGVAQPVGTPPDEAG